MLPQAVKLKDEGNVLFKQAHYREAIGRYTDAIDLATTSASAASSDVNKELSSWYCNRALCHLKTESFGVAAVDARKAIELDATNPKAYYRLGSSHVALGKYRDGMRVFEQVTKLLPRDKDAKAKFDHCQKEVRRIAFEAAIATEHSLLPSEKFDPSQLPQPPSEYKGPRWDSKPEANNFADEWRALPPPTSAPEDAYAVGGITHEFVTEAIDLMKAQTRLPKKYVVKLLLCAKHVLKPLPSLVPITIQPGKTLTVCGDVHGQFYDLLNLFDLAGGRPTRERPYLFNGDFVDRGSFSVEVILTLLLYKCLDPHSIHLLRGNHETKNMNKIYGFEGEVKNKYDMQVNDLFSEVFRYLPLCATINQRVIVMHGGLFQRDGVTLDEISRIPRFSEPPDSGLFSDILWSDPQPFPGRSPSKRGVGQSFGPDVTKRFLQENGLELLVRSHEVRDEGFLVEHDGQLITVFSAPNYCDQLGNKGAYIRFVGGSDPAGRSIAEYKCHSYSHVPHPHVPPMAFADGGMYGL